MGFFSDLWHAVAGYFKRMWNAIKKFFIALFNFAANVVKYFRDKILNPRKHKPFVGDFNKLIKEHLQKAPEKNVGIFRGVYNTETDEIEDLTVVEADNMDSQTKDILRDDPLVLLS